MKKITIKENEKIIREFQIDDDEIIDGKLYLRIKISYEDYLFFKDGLYSVSIEPLNGDFYVFIHNDNLSQNEINRLMTPTPENSKFYLTFPHSELSHEFFKWKVTGIPSKIMPEKLKEDKIDKNEVRESNTNQLSLYIDNILIN